MHIPFHTIWVKLIVTSGVSGVTLDKPTWRVEGLRDNDSLVASTFKTCCPQYRVV